jgi:hypothetical protein
MRIDDLLADVVTVRATFSGNSVAVALDDQAGDSFECRVQTQDGSVRFGGGVTVREATSVTFDGIGSSGDSDPSDTFIGRFTTGVPPSALVRGFGRTTRSGPNACRTASHHRCGRSERRPPARSE